MRRGVFGVQSYRRWQSKRFNRYGLTVKVHPETLARSNLAGLEYAIALPNGSTIKAP